MIFTKAKIKNFTIYHCSSNFTKYGTAFKTIRPEVVDCFMCEKPWEDGDIMGLAFSRNGNLLICTECAHHVQNKLNNEEVIF